MFKTKLFQRSFNVIVGIKSIVQELCYKKKSVGDTGGLPCHIAFVVRKDYVTTTNIDVTNGLWNSAVGNWYIKNLMQEYIWL